MKIDLHFLCDNFLFKIKNKHYFFQNIVSFVYFEKKKNF